MSSINAVFGGVDSRLNTIVEHDDGKVFDLYKHGIVTRDFIVSSPEYSRDFVFVDGGRGAIETNVTLEPRPIRIEFWMKADDNLTSYVRKRDLVFRIFGSGRPFYIRDVREPSKRWRVVLNGQFEMEQNRTYGFFTVEMYALKGVSESTTLITEEFVSKDFVVYNEGDLPITMLSNEDTVISIKNFGKRVKLENKTNGRVWEVKEDMEDGNEIVLKGARSLLDGSSIFSITNKAVMEFASGENVMSVTSDDGSSPTVTVTSRRYFL